MNPGAGLDSVNEVLRYRFRMVGNMHDLEYKRGEEMKKQVRNTARTALLAAACGLALSSGANAAVLAFDLAADKQVCALTDQDSRVLARRTVKAKAWQLADAGMKVLVLDQFASVGQGSNKEAIGGIRATHTAVLDLVHQLGRGKDHHPQHPGQPD